MGDRGFFLLQIIHVNFSTFFYWVIYIILLNFGNHFHNLEENILHIDC